MAFIGHLVPSFPELTHGLSNFLDILVHYRIPVDFRALSVDMLRVPELLFLPLAGEILRVVRMDAQGCQGLQLEFIFVFIELLRVYEFHRQLLDC